ncbi:aryl-alcohol dehydrogenase [Auriscalpium vulgare]|uniref:Aryl-alcohol dehydrogenase n=1 Tax=Auriscalpium vulgare TaxID=40419 RepID=A0ACB8S3Q0_9AGAM|nr:aryl-alcohol dehydrogenase [Auriscalpium vulgare]
MTSEAPRRKVPYVHLGKSGLKVSRIILGCMSYGSTAWMPWLLGEEEGIKHIKAAYDVGIQTFDTANVYSNGLSEEILGKAIRQHNLPRDEIVVMTKVGGIVAGPDDHVYKYISRDPDLDGYVNRYGLSRKHIFDSVQNSLKRLQLDYVDVLQCHRFDANTPIEETMQALHDVVQAGLVRYIGMSSCYAWQFHLMQNYAITHNLTPFISMQNHYNVIYREEEREMMPTLRHFGVGAIPWSPLARGLVTRPLSDANTTARSEADPWHARYLNGGGGRDVIARVQKLAADKGATMAQISLAWVLSKDPVAAPVVGSTSLKNLYDLLGALDIQLTAEDVKFLEEPYRPMPILGH